MYDTNAMLNTKLKFYCVIQCCFSIFDKPNFSSFETGSNKITLSTKKFTQFLRIREIKYFILGFYRLKFKIVIQKTITHCMAKNFDTYIHTQYTT